MELPGANEYGAPLGEQCLELVSPTEMKLAKCEEKDEQRWFFALYLEGEHIMSRAVGANAAGEEQCLGWDFAWSLTGVKMQECACGEHQQWIFAQREPQPTAYPFTTDNNNRNGHVR